MIDQDELMKMAREAGLFMYIDEITLSKYSNAILERAAVECDKVEGAYWSGDGAAAASACGDKIRAFKPIL